MEGVAGQNELCRKFTRQKHNAIPEALTVSGICGPTRGEPRTLNALVDRVIKLFSKDPDKFGLRDDDHSLDVAA